MDSLTILTVVFVISMQPEVTSELSNLYEVLFETRQKLEFLNQVYKLRGSLIQELLYPQYSVTQICKTDTRVSSRSTSCLEKDSDLRGDFTISKNESNISLPSIDENRQETTSEAPFDFSRLDSLLQKAKMVRTVEKPDKKKTTSKIQNNKKVIEPGKEERDEKTLVEICKGNKAKQSKCTPRTNSYRTTDIPKSTYQSSYTKKPFLQPTRTVKRDSHSLPPIRPDNRDLKVLSTEELSLPNSTSNPNSDVSIKPQTIPKPKTRSDSTSLLFPPPLQQPPLPPQYVEALTELKRAQIEIARLLKSDQTKIFSPGKEFMLQFEKLYRRDETPRDRQSYASLLYKEIEEGKFSSNIKKFFLDSLQQHLATGGSGVACKRANSRFLYPCSHCLDPEKASVEGIKIPKFYLLKHFNLCSLLSECYPDTPLSKSGLARMERLQCVDVDELIQLHHLIIDVYSLSLKKDVLATCMRVVPQLDLDQKEDRQALRIVVQILDSSKIITFFNFSFVDN